MTYEEAKEVLKDAIADNGGLFNLGWYLHWGKGQENAVLDGDFDADELEAIAVYMRGPDATE